MSERVKQAIQETLIVAAIAFALSLAGFMSGLSKLPNFEEGRAAFAAAVLAGLVALGKGVVWYFTGTEK